jgi:LPXTG-motif cell wall-anchored protein
MAGTRVLPIIHNQEYISVINGQTLRFKTAKVGQSQLALTINGSATILSVGQNLTVRFAGTKIYFTPLLQGGIIGVLFAEDTTPEPLVLLDDQSNATQVNPVGDGQSSEPIVDAPATQASPSTSGMSWIWWLVFGLVLVGSCVGYIIWRKKSTLPPTIPPLMPQ